MPKDRETHKRYKSKFNTNEKAKYLIPNRKDKTKWAEIEIDYKENIFMCQMKIYEQLSEEWIQSKDFTFASSLLTKFMVTAEYLKE